MGLTFDTSEVDRALAKLLAQDTTPIVAAGADVVAEHWREGAPVKSGNLRDGIYGQTVSPTEGEAAADLIAETLKAEGKGKPKG